MFSLGQVWIGMDGIERTIIFIRSEQSIQPILVGVNDLRCAWVLNKHNFEWYDALPPEYQKFTGAWWAGFRDTTIFYALKSGKKPSFSNGILTFKKP